MKPCARGIVNEEGAQRNNPDIVSGTALVCEDVSLKNVLHSTGVDTPVYLTRCPSNNAALRSNIVCPY